MFQDEQLDPISLPSTWKKERSVKEGGTQTKELPTEDVACQSVKRKSKESQTEGAEAMVQEIEQDESPALLAWLQKIEPLVHKHLSQGSRSHAFDDYEVTWEEQTDAISNSHTLSHAVLAEELQVTGLSWSCTGSVIAASFGRFDHEDWCTHKSNLCTWNLDRRQLEATKPDTVIDLPSCLMCIQCHPKKPSIVAGGTFNGEIMVYDLSKEEESLVATSGIGNDSHREPVSKVHWIPDTSSKSGGKFNILSVSSDGKILMWRMSSHKNTLKLVDGFVLLTDNLPRSMRARRGDQEMGVTCISLSKEDATTFLIGSESGGIFKCSTQATATATSGNDISSMPLKSPVTFTFTPHHGPVYSVDCSPFHRNMFLSCGTDTSARLYTMLEAEPLITLEPGHGYLYGARWSPARPLVFALASEEGSVLVYDLKHNKAAPKYKLETADAKKKHPLYSIQFNPYRPDLLATGDGAGYIRVWKLNDELSHQAAREIEQLEEISNAALE